jgi:Tfp pilus assembly protein PilF
LNENLAKDRAKSGSQALMNEFKKNKNKENQFGKEAAQYNTVTTAEDWDGFKKLMEGSSLPDKDLVLRVLSMYTDPMQREKEIKNLANTYKEIAGQILPKLRRSVLTILVDKNSRTDDEISKLCASTPDSLNLEELLYGATLTEDLNIKTNVYKTAESKFGSDWRTSNNLGVTYLLSNKVDDAKAAFERANKASANNPVVMNNMGAVVAKSGDRRAAMSYYEKAKGAGPEVSYNTGIVLVRDGKYSEAVSSFGEYKGFNLALAQLLAGTPENVSTTIDASKEKEMAMSYYLKAVASARKGDAAGLGFLKTAIEKDGSLKTLAKEDCEFIKWRANGDFSSLTN